MKRHVWRILAKLGLTRRTELAAWMYARHNGHADLLRERIDGRIGQ